MVLTANGKVPMVNTLVLASGELKLIPKLGGSVRQMKTQSPACSEGNVHQRLSCDACHSAWAPQCIGCHNSYEKQTAGFDMLSQKASKGTWVEYAGKILADEPVLGIRQESGKPGSIQTMTPGMILTIDKGSFKKGEKTVFKRLYAPVSAHTIQKESRNCKSCHSNPMAIGYGHGELLYSSKGKWTFNPRFAANPNDGLPEDAWMGFLRERKDISSTRKGYRPFNLEEQKRILTVGACLTCHEPASSVIRRSLNNFSDLLSNRSKKCILPVW